MSSIKIRHINRLEEDSVEYTEPIYEKLNGVYGHLVLDVHRNVWFIQADDHCANTDNVTNQYIIKEDKDFNKD